MFPTLANLQREGFVAMPATRLLGISYAAGKAEPDLVMGARSSGFAARVKKIRNLNKTRAAVGARLLKTGGIPAMLHGVAVNGINNTQLATATRLAHRTVTKNDNPACPTTGFFVTARG